MTSRPCGVCLILNNHNFAKAREGVLEHKHMKDRNGTDVDAGTVNVKDEFANFKNRNLVSLPKGLNFNLPFLGYFCCSGSVSSVYRADTP